MKYDKDAIFQELANAKATIMALKTIPFQRRWVEELQKIQLKMEIAGTSKIEGADFAGNELEAAMKAETAEELQTRSQRQANAVLRAYKSIATIPNDMPIDEELMSGLHGLVITDCDQDHCPPGVIRGYDQNVTFGVPKHRGAIGGKECGQAFKRLAHELQTTFKQHDPLIQALALHYHFAALHPFLDGNGRTARVLEALMLQRAGLKDSLFIAMSNFYYDEKRGYLESLAAVRAKDHDLTPFLIFGLRGVAIQSGRLAQMIRDEVSREIFRNLMRELFMRLESTRKRVIVKRQLILLEKLLDMNETVEFFQLAESMKEHYSTRKNPVNALARDCVRLEALKAIVIHRDDSKPKHPKFHISVNLEWPSTITETEFFAKIEALPKSKTYGFLSPF
jgi:Fic family protein